MSPYPSRQQSRLSWCTGVVALGWAELRDLIATSPCAWRLPSTTNRSPDCSLPRSHPRARWVRARHCTVRTRH
jgi:hypothetical protein